MSTEQRPAKRARRVETSTISLADAIDTGDLLTVMRSLRGASLTEKTKALTLTAEKGQEDMTTLILDEMGEEKSGAMAALHAAAREGQARTVEVELVANPILLTELTGQMLIAKTESEIRTLSTSLPCHISATYLSFDFGFLGLARCHQCICALSAQCIWLDSSPYRGIGRRCTYSIPYSQEAPARLVLLPGPPGTSPTGEPPLASSLKRQC